MTDSKQTITYTGLTHRVATFAGTLQQQEVVKDARVLLCMPMVPEAAIAMLACARLSAVHSVMFGGFAASELAVRIDDAQPKVIVSASCSIEVTRVIEYKPLLDKAMTKASHKPERCIILQRPQATAALLADRDLDWQAAVAHAPQAECTPGDRSSLYSVYLGHNR